jgi:hypothetical protein
MAPIPLELIFHIFSPNGIANGLLQKIRIDLSLDQIVRSTGAHGFDVYFIPTLTRQEDDGYVTSILYCLANELQATSFAETEVEQADVVLFPAYAIKSRLKRFHPMQVEPGSEGFREQILNQIIVIFIILDEKNPQAV